MIHTKTQKLKDFKEVDWEQVLGRFILEKKYETQSKLLKRVLKTIADSLLPKYEYVYETHNSKLLFFISSNNRENVNKTFEEIRKLENGDIIAITTKGRHLDLKIGLYLLFFLIPVWIRQTKKYVNSLNEQFWLLNILIQIYRVDLRFRCIDLKKYNLLTTYYDSLEPESYIIQLFKHQNIKTASLQHGQFVGKCDETFIDCGVELRTFKSDYLLCWNKYTYDEAVKSGISPDKLIIVGIWSYINKQRKFCNKNQNGIFGVVIGHPAFEEENLKLIEAANNLSEKYGISYYLKLHPFYKEEYFSSQVNNHYKGNIKKGISMLDYANQVDFTLIGSTSVFVELIYVGHDIYRFSSGEANDKYKNVKIGKIFNSPDNLIDVFEKERNNDYTDQLFDYLCTVSDVTTAYKNFFEKFK